MGKEEAEKKTKEEAERKAKEEAEQKAKEEAERKEKEEADKKAKEEAERKAKTEAEQKAKEEAERKVKEEAAQSAKAEEPLQKDATGADSSGGFLPLSQLACPSPWPEGVDPGRREDWLSPSDFVKALGMTKEEFSKLPLWKRKKAKESA